MIDEYVKNYPEPYKVLRSVYPGTYRKAIKVGLDHDDINQVAFQGVFRAAQKYDPAKTGHEGKTSSFSSWALWWIRAYVGRAALNYTVEKASLCPRIRMSSGDVRVGKDESVKIWDMIPGKADEYSDEREVLSQKISKVLSRIDKRYREMFELRYGLTGEEPKTLNEVAAMYGLSRERIRQIEDKVFNKILEPLTTIAKDYFKSLAD